MDLSGKTVAVTGTFSTPRAQIEARLEALGAQVASSITKSTSLLFAGEGAGSKRAKAEQLGIAILGQADLDALLGGRTLEASPRELAVGTSRLGDFRERLLAKIAELESRSDVKVLYKLIGAPVSPAAVDAAVASRGITLTPEEREFYARMNGCFLVWVPVNDAAYDKAIHKPKKGRPPMTVLESLDSAAFRILAMPPIEEVFGRPFDYGRFLDDKAPRLGFDFPGNYTTPAFMVFDGALRVQVGDDHGACWDAGYASFEDYVETVLAIWGDDTLRREIFLQGKHGSGRAYFEAHPVPLTQLLPPPPPKSAAEEIKLLRLLKRKLAHTLSDEEIAEAARATHATNDELVTTALYQLGQLPAGVRPHASVLVDALAAWEHASDGQPIRNHHQHLADIASVLDVAEAPLSLAERITVLRSGAYRWVPVGRIAAAGGTEMLGTLETLIRQGAEGLGDRVLAAVHAATLLGPLAAPLLPSLKALVQPADFEARTKWGWDDRVTLSLAAATAVVSIEPERAPEFFEHLRILVRSVYVSLAHRGQASSDLTPLMARLPEEVSGRLAVEVAELANGASRELIVLLTALSGGVDLALDALERGPRPDAVLPALVRASLNHAQRARVVAFVRSQMEGSVTITGEQLARVAHFGGIEAWAPTIERDEALKVLARDARYLRDHDLVRLVFPLLRSEGADPAQLRASAVHLLATPEVSRSPLHAWLSAFSAETRAHGERGLDVV